MDENVLVGLHTGDDSGVYRLTPTLALVQTLDFITPVIDDPYLFGQIAAANSLSDVYAMGGVPVTAMNILCLPKGLERERVGDILAGGASKIAEAGASLVGGHTVENPELVYGLSVTGTIHPDHVLANAGARPGDALVLTKPLGSGLVNSLVKAGRATKAEADAVGRAMASLNRAAAAPLREVEAHAVTDVTGFGLAGHAVNIARESGVDLTIRFDSLPLLPGVDKALASRKTIPAGTRRNRDAYACRMEIAAADAERVGNIVCDPQTSGGLLVALPEARAEHYLRLLGDQGVEAARIGEVCAGRGVVRFV